MKAGISSVIRSRIKAVARLRVEGATWASIATRYGYKQSDSARQSLTLKYPDRWRTAYELARALYLDEIEGEAVLTQRELLRPTRIVKRLDRKTGETTEERVDNPLDIRQRAAHSVLAHCAKLRAQKVELTGRLSHEHDTTSVDIEARVRAYAEALLEGDVNPAVELPSEPQAPEVTDA